MTRIAMQRQPTREPTIGRTGAEADVEARAETKKENENVMKFLHRQPSEVPDVVVLILLGAGYGSTDSVMVGIPG